MIKTKSRTITDMRPILWLGLLFSTLLLVQGCDRYRADRVAFDGVYFRSNASAVEKQRQNFEIKVAPVSSSFDGAREAGRYEATRYCIENFGTSNLVWSQGPDAEAGTLQIDNDNLILRGTCKPQ